MPRNGVLREFFGEKYFFLQNITFIHTFAPLDSLAQQVEHIPFKDGVLGSSPRRITEKESQIVENQLSAIFILILRGSSGRGRSKLSVRKLLFGFPLLHQRIAYQRAG